jgi:hypothetical protein
VQPGRDSPLGAGTQQVPDDRSTDTTALEYRINLDPAQDPRVGPPVDVESSSYLIIDHDDLGPSDA